MRLEAGNFGNIGNDFSINRVNKNDSNVNNGKEIKAAKEVGLNTASNVSLSSAATKVGKAAMAGAISFADQSISKAQSEQRNALTDNVDFQEMNNFVNGSITNEIFQKAMTV